MNFKALAILLSLIAVAVVIISVSGGLSSSSSSYSSPSYEEAIMTVEEQERANPSAFLTTDGTYRENLIGQWVLEGKISNTATIANYKDAVLTVEYYSKTKTLLGTENFIVYEYFNKGQAKEFKIKTAGYRGTASIGWEVTDASTVDES